MIIVNKRTNVLNKKRKKKQINTYVVCQWAQRKRISAKMIFRKCKKEAKIYIYIYNSYWVNAVIVLFDEEVDGVDSSSCSSLSSS
jgi:hypothetical protein